MPVAGCPRHTAGGQALSVLGGPAIGGQALRRARRLQWEALGATRR